MKQIKSWRERVNEGDSIFAKATALEAEVAELRAYIGDVEKAHRETPDAVLTATFRKIYESRRQGHPIAVLLMRPNEMRLLEDAVASWMIEKTAVVGTKKFNGILLEEDENAPSVLPA